MKRLFPSILATLLCFPALAQSYSQGNPVGADWLPEGSQRVGRDDFVEALVKWYGDNGTKGATTRWYNAAAEDGTIDYFYAEANGTNLIIGGNAAGGTIILDGDVTITGVFSGTQGSLNLSSPPPIGDVTPNSGAFTTLTATTPIADASIADTLIIGAASTVDDGALSANIGKLNAAANVTGAWTIGALSTVDDGALSANIGKLNAAANVTGAWTIGAASTVNDAALSANVPRLNSAATITGNWVNMVNPWADNEVVNDLTIASTKNMSTTGTLKVGAGTTTPSTNTDLYVSDAAGNTGINILTPDGFNGYIMFGDALDVDGGRITYNSADILQLYASNSLMGSFSLSTDSYCDFGQLDDHAAYVRAMGNATTTGGVFRLYNAGGEDTTTDFWSISANDSLDFFGDASTNVLSLTEAGVATFPGNSIVMSSNAAGSLALSVEQELSMQSQAGVVVDIDSDNDGTTAYFQVEKDGSTDVFTVNESGQLDLTGSITWNAANTYNLGSATYRIEDIYADDVRLGSNDAIEGTQWIYGSSGYDGGGIRIYNGHDTADLVTDYWAITAGDGAGNGYLTFWGDTVKKMSLNEGGDLLPATDDLQDLGSSLFSWNYVYGKIVDTSSITIHGTLDFTSGTDTISLDVLTPTTPEPRVAAESGVIDQVTSIVGDSGWFAIRAQPGHTITFRDNGSSLDLGGDRVLNHPNDVLMVMNIGSGQFIEMSYADNQ